MRREFFFFLILAGMFFSCSEYSPKPRGYIRLEPATPHYVILPETNLPYTFHISDKISVELSENQNEGWLNLSYDTFNAKIYCSFFPITRESLSEATKESFKFVDKITRQANVSSYENQDTRVYATLFELEGNVASPIQFYLTDSVSGFFRGALYFHAVPNADSLAPMTDYLRADIVELIQTFSWKN